MNLNRGDVVLVEFPLSPGQRSRRRPALVVQSDHNNHRMMNSIFAMITTNTSLAGREAAQCLIDLAVPDGRQSGLAQNSAVKCENLHTLPTSAVSRILGSLPAALMAQVDECLRASLGLRS